MQNKVRAHVTISGRVQGVFYRMETLRAAERIGVCGWVRNRRDDTVEAVFEGDKQQVDAIIDWCWNGPDLSRVDDIKLRWEDYTGEFNRFDVMY
jgi:acylphosphatase